MSATADIEADEQNISHDHECVKDEKPTSEISVRSLLVLVGSILSYFATMGFMNAFGVFQQYYTAHYLPKYDNFQVSWIGSVNNFCIFAAAAPAGIIADRYGSKVPITIGAVTQVVAIFMVSLCRQYYQFFLAQAVLLGVGMSFIAIPTSTYVPMYFKRNQGLAQGISIGGASLGGLVWPVALDHMLNRRRIGFGWTMRVVAFTMIPMLAVVLLTLRPPMSAAAASRPADKEQQRQDSSRGDDDDVSASTGTVEKETPPIVFSLKRPAYILLCFGLAFAYFGFFAPLFYVSVYATHLGHSENFAFYLVSILNGASLFGRTLPGFMADKYGHFNVIVVAVLGSAVVVFSWTMAVSIAGLVVWTFAYGFVSGAILSQQLACAGLLSTPETRGVAVGFVMASVSLAGLFGTPIAGALVRHGYLALSCFAGAMLITGAVFLAGARIAVGKKLLAKV